MPQKKSRLRASINRWANTDQHEAQELRRDSERAGVMSIVHAPDRAHVTVQGTLRTVTLRPRGGVPALEAELYDGSGSLTVIWLGRRRIGGIVPGAVIRVEGRVGVHDRQRIIFNPSYELQG